MHNGPQSTRTHTHKSNPNLSLFHSSGIFAKTEKLCAEKKRGAKTTAICGNGDGNILIQFKSCPKSGSSFFVNQTEMLWLS